MGVSVASMKISKLFCYLAVLGVAAQFGHAQIIFNQFPSRILGQPPQPGQNPTASALNLVEGRELNAPQSVALDLSSNPPSLYIADTGNNRVLGFKNAAALSKGDFSDLVIGQRDKFSVRPKGPGTELTSGLNGPTAVAVDASGNLYVADAGNNRILRYPKPFSQTSDLITPDLVIGQRDFAGRSPNEGNAAPSQTTLNFSSNGLSRVGLAFDAQGNLWVSDATNNRVLRYPVSSLGTGAANEPAADLVLGQPDFVSNSLPSGTARNTKGFLAAPAGIGFDPQGRLYVTDNGFRVMVYVPPFVSGMSAARIMGVVLPTQQTPPPAISAQTLGNQTLNPPQPPEAVFFIGNNPFVIDTGNNRILKYDPIEQWPLESTQFSPSAIAVIGQPDFSSNKPNRGLSDATADSFNFPVAGAVSGSDVFIADSRNNRVLGFPIQGGNISAATRVIGQLDFIYSAPNLVEGRELFLYNGQIPETNFIFGGGGLAVDTSSDPPHLYISDSLNNRILGYRDYRRAKAGDRADIVIGQPDFFHTGPNSPNGQVSDRGLSVPANLVVDKNGDLYVADSGNSRVLRFPRPFDQAGGIRPNLVLGQVSFFAKFTDATAQNLRTPYGLALTSAGDLLVSDISHNRILFFRKQGSDFTGGQSASAVIGQPDFISINPGSSNSSRPNGPHGIATDLDDKLYVADTGNSRILIYRNIPTAGNDPQPSQVINTGLSGDGLNAPHAVFVNKKTSEIFVADTLDNRVLRYPDINQLLLNGGAANASIPSALPLAISLDLFGNPIVAEGANRVSFFFPRVLVVNAANYFPRIAPGMLATLFPTTSSAFGTDTASFDALPNPLPIPTTLGDVQVTVAGVSAPVLYASPGQVNFQVPMGTQLGNQEITIVRASTGQVLASGLYNIEPASPALFTLSGTGNGQVAATDEAGKINSGTNPIKAGHVVTLYGTGQGSVTGAPADGQPAAGAINTDDRPRVIINQGFVKDQDILYSGLAPGFVGVFQLNVRVPSDVPPGDVLVVVQFKGANSTVDQFGNRRQTTIRTAQ